MVRRVSGEISPDTLIRESHRTDRRRPRARAGLTRPARRARFSSPSSARATAARASATSTRARTTARRCRTPRQSRRSRTPRACRGCRGRGSRAWPAGALLCPSRSFSCVIRVSPFVQCAFHPAPRSACFVFHERRTGGATQSISSTGLRAGSDGSHAARRRASRSRSTVSTARRSCSTRGTTISAFAPTGPRSGRRSARRSRRRRVPG